MERHHHGGNLVKPTLNLGCGPDPWGDVRVDRGLWTQTGLPSRTNVIADAHSLPFRTGAFSDCRCFHVLEHCKRPNDVLKEIKRVSDRATLRFPLGDITRDFIICLLNLDVKGLRHNLLTKMKHAHLWSIQPNSRTATRNSREILGFLHYGRKARLFTRFRPRIAWEWEMTIAVDRNHKQVLTKAVLGDIRTSGKCSRPTESLH